MAESSTGVLVRQRAYFAAFVEMDELDPFPAGALNQVTVSPSNQFKARTLLGRGPVQFELATEPMLFFEQGPTDFPTFECPGIGPEAAACMVAPTPQKVAIAADEALAVIEVAGLFAASSDLWLKHQQASHRMKEPPTIVDQWQRAAQIALDQYVGLYALYQYPVVWKPLAREPQTAFIDFGSMTVDHKTIKRMDAFVPFQLRPGGYLKDGLLQDRHIIESPCFGDPLMHFPLLLFQRTLWQKEVSLRLMETVLMLENLVGQAELEDEDRPQREELFQILENCTRDAEAKHRDRLNAVKGLILQAPLRDRLRAYLTSLNIAWDDEALRNVLRIRNDVAHGRPVNEGDLEVGEQYARELARLALRRELARRGTTFGSEADFSLKGPSVRPPNPKAEPFSATVKFTKAKQS